MNLTGTNNYLDRSPRETIEEEVLSLSQADKFNSTHNSVQQNGGDVDFFFTASIEPGQDRSPSRFLKNKVKKAHAN